MMEKHEDDDDNDNGIAATQAVTSLLLSGVVAYVEVRSGHDNRSRGVKTQLRNLGATIAETFTRDVTHVVFNEGLPSTYTKAKKLNCHLVSVLWIEACKEQLTKVSEGGYPPIGKQIYDNPRSLKNIKKQKSMQPDFDEETADAKTEKIIKQLQRRGRKAKADTNLEVLPEETPDNQVKSTTKTERKKRASAKGSKTKTALREITPDVVNKDTSNNNTESQALNIPMTGNESSPLLVESASSSSVICLGEEVQAGPSSITTKKSKKSDMSRAEFVEGLGQIVFSLSKENEKRNPSMSPWRKCPLVPASKISRKKMSPITPPRRSPRHPASSALSPVESKRIQKTEAKDKVVPSSYISASAALNRRRKMLPPSSPDFLLSQEPGDMPSIDELAKTKRVSIHLGAEKISISQVVRAYDAVAQGSQGQLKSSQSSESIYLSCQAHNDKDEVEHEENHQPGEHKKKVFSKNDSLLVGVEDISCDSEIARHSENRSDAGSSVSSFSTKVLINGMSTQSSKVVKSSFALPGSEEMDYENISLQVNEAIPPSQDICERVPSPVFVIKKPRFRKALKKLSGGSKLSTEQIDAVERAGKVPDHSKENEVLNSSEQKRSSLNPIDYINKLFLPKFLTPASKGDQTLVEETPDVNTLMRTETENIVIPPTPAENSPESEVKPKDASQSPSLTSSVLSWVRKSCKVPLFASRTTPISASSEVDSTPKLLTGSYSKRDNAPERSNSCEDSKKVRSGAEKSKSKTVRSLTEQTKQISSPVTRKKRVTPSQPSNNKSEENFKNCGKEENVTKVQASSSDASEDLGALKGTRRKRGQVVVSVVKNQDVESSNNLKDKGRLDPKLSPGVVLQNGEDVHCSSGYDTSHSNNCSNHESKSSSSSETNVKRRKIVTVLSPGKSEAKKRSAVYDCDQAVEGESHDSKESSTRKSGRKRAQTAQKLDCKMPRLAQSSPEPERSHLSRADSKRRTESVSFEGAKSSENKSTELAKKRMAKSLTRTHTTDVPKVIVCTFLTASEQNGIAIAGESLHAWKHEDKVTARTTHVINSGPKRTINMLKGMVRGCWLVDQQWMLDSAEARSWLPEGKYELAKFSPAVKQCRVKRQLLGKEFKHSLFTKVGPIFVSSKTQAPPAKDVKELLELCSAELKTSPVDCKIVVGEKMCLKGNFNCVNSKWVLDCITKNKILSVKSQEYIIE